MLAVEGGSKEFEAKFVMESNARTGNIEGTKVGIHASIVNYIIIRINPFVSRLRPKSRYIDEFTQNTPHNHADLGRQAQRMGQL